MLLGKENNENEGGVMGTVENWNEFKRRQPELAEQVHELVMALYGLGADRAKDAKELQTLKGILKGSSQDDLRLLGITALTDAVLLHAVFVLGGDLLLNTERGGQP